MGQARRFLLLAAAVILVILLFLVDDQNRDSTRTSTSNSGGQARISHDEDGLRPWLPDGGGSSGHRGAPPSRTSKRSGEWTDAPTRLEVLVVDEETQVPIPGTSVYVADVWTWNRKFSGETGPDGSVSLEVDRGHYRLFARHPGYLSPHISVAAEGPETRRTIPLLARGPETLVTGLVRDRTGQGVPEAFISVRADPKSGIGEHLPRKRPPDFPIEIWNQLRRRAEVPRHTTTDRNGFFSLKVPEGRFSLSVSKLRFEPYTDVIQVPTSGPLEINLTEPNELLRLSGWVSGEEGRPLAGAKVNLELKMNSGMPGFDHATTDSEGYFEFDLPPGLATVSTQFKGYRKYREVHEVTRDTEIFPVLKTFLGFTVKVYDSKGRIVEDPFVIGTALESGKGVVSPVRDGIDRSKPTQTYQASEYPFRIYATALHLGRGITEAKEIRSYQANIDLRVRGGGRIEGNVADTDGNPVRDFTIVLRRDGFDLGIFRSFSQEGRFSLEGIPPGLYSLSFHSRPEMDPTELATVRPKLVMVQNDRTSFLDVVLRPQGWVKTAGQISRTPDSRRELRPEY